MKKFFSLFFVIVFSLPLSAQQILQGITLPQVAVNATGDTAVVWSQYSQTLNFPIIMAATKGASETSFTLKNISATTLSSQILQFASNAQVVIDGSGNAVAIWQQTNITLSSNNVIYAAVKIKGESSWRTPVAVSKTTFTNGLISQPLTSARTPQLYLDPFGNAVALWSQFNQATNSFMIYISALLSSQFSTTPAPWSNPVQLSTTQSKDSTTINLFNAANPRMAINSKGAEIVVWSQANNKVGASMIFASLKGAGATSFSTPIQLSTTFFTTSTGVVQTLQEATVPQVGINDSGLSTVVWVQFNQTLGFNMIFVAFQLSDGSWSEPLQLSETTFGSSPTQPLFAASNPQIVVDGKGNVVVI